MILTAIFKLDVDFYSGCILWCQNVHCTDLAINSIQFIFVV